MHVFFFHFYPQTHKSFSLQSNSIALPHLEPAAQYCAKVRSRSFKIETDWSKWSPWTCWKSGAGEGKEGLLPIVIFDRDDHCLCPELD